MNQSDQFINHEVRIQICEEVAKDIKQEIKNNRIEMHNIRLELQSELKGLRKDMHSQFKWIITILLTSVLLPVIAPFLSHWIKS